MSVRVGSARSSYGNTTAGDQYKGLEVSTQAYYVHSKGWRVFRCIYDTMRNKIAEAMELACKNNDIGYDQSTRLTLRNEVKDKGFDPSKTTKKVNTDCSALVRVCCEYAGIEVPNFTTPYEAEKLLATGYFIELTGDKYTKSSTYLARGDILVTKTKGHTVVVLDNGPKVEDSIVQVDYKLGDRVLKNGCEGTDVKELQTILISLGYDCGKWGADGDYGDCTAMAVRQFQTDNGLVISGEFGSEDNLKLTLVVNAQSTTAGTSVEIIGGNCYVRTTPDTDGAVIGVAHSGSSYVFANSVSDAGWLKILFKNTEGWVSGKYGKRV